MTSTRELIDQLTGLASSAREEDAPQALVLGVELVGRAVIALEDLAHHFNAKAPSAKPEAVYSHEGCTFHYCPHPGVCKQVPSGCSQVGVA